MIYPPDTTLAYVAVPAVPMPAYLGTVEDPVWGTRITRISAADGQANQYAKQQCWNADGSLLLFSRVFPGLILDGRTYAVLDGPNTGTGTPGFHPDTFPKWHATNPRILYGQSTNQIRQMDPLVDQVRTVVRTFTPYTMIDQTAQGNPSDDGRYWSLAGKAPDNSWSLFVWDTVSDVIVATKTGFTAAPHAMSMSPSGAYVIVGWQGDGFALQQGTWLYDNLLRPIRQLHSSTSHADCGWDTTGHEVWVGSKGTVSSGTQTIYAMRLDTVCDTPILPNFAAHYWGHVSCRNTARRGWAYLSNYDTVTPSGRPGLDQLIAVKLDGSMTVEVFGHAHHGADIAAKNPYATVSRDGGRMLWASAWNVAGGPAYAYIAEADRRVAAVQRRVKDRS